MAGVEQRTTAAALGHATTEMTERYQANVPIESLRAAMDRVDAYRRTGRVFEIMYTLYVHLVVGGRRNSGTKTEGPAAQHTAGPSLVGAEGGIRTRTPYKGH